MAGAAQQKPTGSGQKQRLKKGAPEINSLQEENSRLQAHNSTLQRANKRLESQISIHLLPFCRSREAAAKLSQEKLEAEQEQTELYRNQQETATLQLQHKAHELERVQR